MPQAITKKWLRKQYKQSGSEETFRAWARTEGRFMVESAMALDAFPDGPDINVSKLTGVEMGDGAGLKHMELLEQQKARKELSGVRARATQATRRARKGKLKK